jgi:hypothetical protein
MHCGGEFFAHHYRGGLAVLIGLVNHTHSNGRAAYRSQEPLAHSPRRCGFGTPRSRFFNVASAGWLSAHLSDAN